MGGTMRIPGSLRGWYLGVPLPSALVAAFLLFAQVTQAAPVRLSYPLTPESKCGSTRVCSTVLEQWNSASWADLVNEDFNSGSLPLASVRWYTTEYPCTGLLCNDQLHAGDGSCPVRSV